MNLSLVRDVLKRNRERQSILRPPGCCVEFVEHPAPWLRSRMCVQVGIAIEHRFAFWAWMRVKAGLRKDRRTGGRIPDREFLPPDLLTMDWHDDVGGKCDFIGHELCRLNQLDETEVGFFCWAALRPLNDGHVAPAMWLNAIGDVYVVAKQWQDPEEHNRVFVDRYDQEHRITYLRTPGDLVEYRDGTNGGNGIIWDIDLDYFTEAKEVPDQRYTPVLSDEAIAGLLDPEQAWVREVLADLRGVTIALEPEYTGGMSRSLHLLEEWEKALLTAPLFDKQCAWRSVFE